MKEKEFLDRLNRELDSAVPPMSDRLKSRFPANGRANADNALAFPPPSAPLSASDSHSFSADVFRKINRGRIVRAVSATAAAALLFSVGLTSYLSFRPTAPVVPEISPSVIYVDINPSLALTIDENGKVEKVLALNEDADVLTANNALVATLPGSNVRDAVIATAERAAETGYLDLLNEGGEDSYNLITLTVTSAQPDEKTADGLAVGLTDYFREKGIYVYVETVLVENAETSLLIDAYAESDSSYIGQLAATGESDSLLSVAEKSVYDGARELLGDALKKFDLYDEIYTLNQKLVNLTENVFFMPESYRYWLTDESALSEEAKIVFDEITKKLELLALLYGEDFRKRDISVAGLFTRCYSAVCGYDGSEKPFAETLRTLYETGLCAENFGGFGAKQAELRVNYCCFVSRVLGDEACAKLSLIMEEIWQESIPSVEDILTELTDFYSERANLLSEKYSRLYESAREPIDEISYAEFLKRIGKIAD